MVKTLSFILVAFAAFFFMLPSVGLIAPWDYDVSGRTWAEYHKAIDFYMGARMPVIAVSCMGAMLLFLILNWQHRKEKPFLFMLTALCIQILLTVIAINTNVALNPIINQWDPEHLPANWAAMRDEWLGYHHFNAPFNMGFATCIFLSCYFYWTKDHNTSSKESV
jgi:hypothetical protein